MYCAIYSSAKNLEQKECAHTFSVSLHCHTVSAARTEVPVLVRGSSSPNEPFQQGHALGLGLTSSSSGANVVLDKWGIST